MPTQQPCPTSLHHLPSTCTTVEHVMLGEKQAQNRGVGVVADPANMPNFSSSTPSQTRNQGWTRATTNNSKHYGSNLGVHKERKTKRTRRVRPKEHNIPSPDLHDGGNQGWIYEQQQQYERRGVTPTTRPTTPSNSRGGFTNK